MYFKFFTCNTLDTQLLDKYKIKTVYIFIIKNIYIPEDKFLVLTFIILLFWNFSKISMIFLQTYDIAEKSASNSL